MEMTSSSETLPLIKEDQFQNTKRSGKNRIQPSVLKRRLIVLAKGSSNLPPRLTTNVVRVSRLNLSEAENYDQGVLSEE
jgi:hypothetical protein